MGDLMRMGEIVRHSTWEALKAWLAWREEKTRQEIAASVTQLKPVKAV